MRRLEQKVRWQHVDVGKLSFDHANKCLRVPEPQSDASFDEFAVAGIHALCLLQVLHGGTLDLLTHGFIRRGEVTSENVLWHPP